MISFKNLFSFVLRKQSQVIEATIKKNELGCEEKSIYMNFFSCIKSNNIEQAKTFLDKNIDINYQDGKGNTALHYACQNNSSKTAELLLQSDANPNIKNKEGNTPVLIICSTYHQQIDKSISEQEWHEKLDKKMAATAKILIQYGAKIDVSNCKHELPLVLAVGKFSDNLVKLFIENGADALKKDGGAICALGVALRYKQQKNVETIFVNAKKSQQIDAFLNINSLYPGTSEQYEDFLKNIKLKLELENKLPENKKTIKMMKI